MVSRLCSRTHAPLIQLISATDVLLRRLHRCRAKTGLAQGRRLVMLVHAQLRRVRHAAAYFRAAAGQACDDVQPAHDEVALIPRGRYKSEKSGVQKESFLSKLKIGTFLLLSTLLLGSLTDLHAQGLSAYFGLGSASDSAGTSTNVIDANTGATVSCSKGFLLNDLVFPSECDPGPTIGGVFGVFGADFMLKPHLGFNGEYAFRFAQADYLPVAGLKFRPGFYDFNAVYEPISGSDSRIVPVVEGGIGGARIALYQTQTVSVTGIKSTFSYPEGLNANHFQVHGALGVKLYVKGNIFIKPQFDIHYVTHLTDQFGRNWVPEYTVAVGYSFGQH